MTLTATRIITSIAARLFMRILSRDLQRAVDGDQAAGALSLLGLACTARFDRPTYRAFGVGLEQAIAWTSFVRLRTRRRPQAMLPASGNPRGLPSALVMPPLRLQHRGRSPDWVVLPSPARGLPE